MKQLLFKFSSCSSKFSSFESSFHSFKNVFRYGLDLYGGQHQYFSVLNTDVPDFNVISSLGLSFKISRHGLGSAFMLIMPYEAVNPFSVISVKVVYPFELLYSSSHSSIAEILRMFVLQADPVSSKKSTSRLIPFDSIRLSTRFWLTFFWRMALRIWQRSEGNTVFPSRKIAIL